MDELCRMLLDRGAAVVGWADLGPIPGEARHGLPRGVSIVVALNSRIVASIASGPTVEYHAEYCRVNEMLNQLATEAAKFLEGRGGRAVPLAATAERLDRRTLSTALPHKTVATRAGIGWVGKCALLVTEQFGSAIRLTTVLTDAPLPVGQPVEESQCGECDECVRACPAHAPSGRQWQAGLSRADFFDAFACCEMAKSLSAGAGLDATICGICIAACPWTKCYLSKSSG